MHLDEIAPRNFRNLEIPSISCGAGVNLVLGRNGVGKTSLLEAIAVLGNLRSFRTPSPRPLVRHGEQFYRLSGRVHSGGRSRRLEQVVETTAATDRQLSIDGVPATVAEYLPIFPVAALSGSDRELVVGGPDVRRAFLDRFAFLLWTTHLDHLRVYRRALQQRNAALADGRGQDAVWEEPLAAAAARLVVTRRQAAERLAQSFASIYASLAGDTAMELAVEYRVDRWLEPHEGRDEVEERLRKRYNETRVRDRETGFTGDGPHRHDLGLRTLGRSVRHVLSTGQAKVVAAALRLATHKEVERERNESLPVIVDDVDAELDRETLARLVRYLGDSRQVFMSSVDERNLDAPGQRIWLDQGACVRQETKRHE